MPIEVLELMYLISLFFLGYFLVVNSTYIGIHLASFLALRQELGEDKWSPMTSIDASPFAPSVAVVIPAYNEEEVVVECVKSLLNIEYPELEVILVNDGSTDSTLEYVLNEFDLSLVEAKIPFNIPCNEINQVFVSRVTNLTVIDKNQGGKADALNAGIFLSQAILVCSVDADSIIERSSIHEVIKPFLRKPDKTVASGGAVRIANGCDIERGQVNEVGLSKTPITRLQEMEYIRSFITGRVGLSMLRSLLIISGSFSIFKSDIIKSIGGFRTDSITEDMEAVVRMHCKLRDADIDYEAKFVPQPVVWSQAPSDLSGLSRQRRRWFNGLIETLVTHRYAVGRRRYGAIGLFALPFYILVEAIGRLIEAPGYLFIPIALFLGVIDLEFFLLFFVVSLGLGVLLSWISVLSEVIGFNRYSSPRDIAVLLLYGVLENLVYRQWRSYIAWRGLIDYLRGDKHWGLITREEFSDSQINSAD